MSRSVDGDEEMCCKDDEDEKEDFKGKNIHHQICRSRIIIYVYFRLFREFFLNFIKVYTFTFFPLPFLTFKSVTQQHVKTVNELNATISFI